MLQTDLPLLTDDEVVALAVDREMLWPAGTPTVDPESREQVAGAAFRGDRSLLARALLRSGNSSSPAELIGDHVRDAPGSIVAYIGDGRFARVSWGIASAHYPVPSGWLLETVSAAGLHRFSVEPLPDHCRYLEALLSGARDSGPDGGDGDEQVCILALGGLRTLRLAIARRGVVALADGSGEQAGEFGPFASTTPAEAISALVACVTATRLS